MRKTLMLAVLVVTNASADGNTGIMGIIADEGSFNFTDESSVYSFFQDGSFLLEPLGLSGRAIEGYWETEDYSVFQITGTWTWYNGVSLIDDFRRMEVCITLLSEEPDTLESLWQGTDTPVYSVYFTIDEVVSLEATPER